MYAWDSLYGAGTNLHITQSREISVPAASPLAVHTRTAQMQDKVEQQHLKRLVLDYEQREEAEELKGEAFISTFTEPFVDLPKSSGN